MRGPDRARGVLLLEQQRRRHDHVGVHGPERHAQRAQPSLWRHPSVWRSGLSSPTTSAGFTSCQERQQQVIRRSAQHEPDAAPREAVGQFGQPLDEKPVVPQVGALDERVQAEEHHHRLLQRVAGLDRDVERRVVGGPLRALHPVHDAPPVGIGRAGAAHADARIAGQRLKHDCAASAPSDAAASRPGRAGSPPRGGARGGR